MAQEFEPYVQINPTQQVRDIYSPGPARALAQFPKAGDAGIGKALSSLVPALLDYQGIQDKEAKKKQDAEAQAIVASKDANELAALLQKNIKDGKVPPGYSVYLLRQVNAHLGQKVFREFAIEADKELAKFKDANSEVTAEGLLAEAQQKVFHRLGLDVRYGSAEFQKSYGNAYNEYATDFRRRAGKLRSDAKMEQGLQVFEADIVSAIQDLADPSSEDIKKAIAPIIKASKAAMVGVGNWQAKAIGHILDHALVLIQSGDQNKINEAGDLLDALEGVDLVGNGSAKSKTKWGHTFSTVIGDIENKKNQAMRVAQDYGTRDKEKHVNLFSDFPDYTTLAEKVREEAVSPTDLHASIREAFTREGIVPAAGAVAAVAREIRLAGSRVDVGGVQGAEAQKTRSLTFSKQIRDSLNRSQVAEVMQDINDAAERKEISAGERVKLIAQADSRRGEIMVEAEAVEEEIRQIRRATASKASSYLISDKPVEGEPDPTGARRNPITQANQEILGAIRSLIQAKYDEMLEKHNKQLTELKDSAEYASTKIRLRRERLEWLNQVSSNAISVDGMAKIRDASFEQKERMQGLIDARASEKHEAKKLKSGPEEDFEKSKELMEGLKKGRPGVGYNPRNGVISWDSDTEAGWWMKTIQWEYDETELEKEIEEYKSNRDGKYAHMRKWTRKRDKGGWVFLDQSGISIDSSKLKPSKYIVYPPTSFAPETAKHKSDKGRDEKLFAVWQQSFGYVNKGGEWVPEKYRMEPKTRRDLREALRQSYHGNGTAALEKLIESGTLPKEVEAMLRDKDGNVQNWETHTGVIHGTLPMEHQETPASVWRRQKRLHNRRIGSTATATPGAVTTATATPTPTTPDPATPDPTIPTAATIKSAKEAGMEWWHDKKNDLWYTYPAKNLLGRPFNPTDHVVDKKGNHISSGRSVNLPTLVKKDPPK